MPNMDSLACVSSSRSVSAGAGSSQGGGGDGGEGGGAGELGVRRGLQRRSHAQVGKAPPFQSRACYWLINVKGFEAAAVKTIPPNVYGHARVQPAVLTLGSNACKKATRFFWRAQAEKVRKRGLQMSFPPTVDAKGAPDFSPLNIWKCHQATTQVTGERSAQSDLLLRAQRKSFGFS